MNDITCKVSKEVNHNAAEGDLYEDDIGAVYIIARTHNGSTRYYSAICLNSGIAWIRQSKNAQGAVEGLQFLTEGAHFLIED